MIFQHQKLLGAVLLLAFDAAAPAGAEGLPPCDVNQLQQLALIDLSDYEKIQKNFFSGEVESALGGTAEYYYSTDILKAVKSVYYGETGKVEWEYYFESPSISTYTAKVTDYYYSVPIYRENSNIVAINQSNFSVCRGERVKGVGTNEFTEQFNRASSVLETLLSKVPRK